MRAKEKRLDQLIGDYDERLDNIRAEHRQIIHDARAEAEEILRGSNAQIERTIKEIRQQQAEKERTRELRRQLDEFKQRINAEDPQEPTRLKELTPKDKPRRKQPKRKAPQPLPKDRPLQAGDNVVLKGTTTVGTLISIDEKYALVAFGNIKTRIEADKVERTMRKEKTAKVESLGRSTSDEIRTRQLNFKPDIDVNAPPCPTLTWMIGVSGMGQGRGMSIGQKQSSHKRRETICKLIFWRCSLMSTLKSARSTPSK